MLGSEEVEMGVVSLHSCLSFHKLRSLIIYIENNWK
jgi:hypothetical protein